MTKTHGVVDRRTGKFHPSNNLASAVATAAHNARTARHKQGMSIAERDDATGQVTVAGNIVSAGIAGSKDGV
jgi:hypothetical protein